MEEMKCTYDAYQFSPRAALLRRAVLLLAHPMMLILPAALVAASPLTPDPGVAAAVGILLFFLLKLVRCFRGAALARLDGLARRDARRLRQQDPQRYLRLRPCPPGVSGSRGDFR